MSAVAHAPRRGQIAAPSSAKGDSCLALAEASYARAAYGECRSILRALDARAGSARGTLALLEARCARDEGVIETWSSSAQIAATEHPDPAGRLEGIALRALAHRHAGRTALADRDIKALQAKIESEPSVAAGFPTYFAGYDAWTRGALDDAEAFATAALASDDARPFATALLGACALARDRFAKAASHFGEVLRLSRAQAAPNLRLLATTLCDASSLACAALDLKFAKKLQRDFAEFVWPSELIALRLRAIANFRVIAMLEGDLERAWLYARDAAALAHDGASVVFGETHAAVASRLLGDERVAHLQLRRAFETIRGQRFSSGDDDARVALATFAREAASDMPTEARKAMTAFESLAPSDLKTDATARERSIRAFGAMAQGRIAEVRGNYDVAYDRYVEAFEGWRDLHDLTRAALVALDLQRFARDPLFDEALDAALERAPDAWFAPQASPASELLARMTPAETLVLGALLGGKSARAIADDLERSVHTINNHTRKIFAAFGVTSRAAVLARCAELGITPMSLDRIV